ncbi:unnamed protein product [Protopolystoma xenopodis]|uniref:Uncharacterized protein n=1 Tax=Protopolystoma xenopodis TaxID=117903 RepID=A0A3S4ZPV1_9PLAT|nr:unnamed protein product [Protopolystoma xenopodis]
MGSPRLPKFGSSLRLPQDVTAEIEASINAPSSSGVSELVTWCPALSPRQPDFQDPTVQRTLLGALDYKLTRSCQNMSLSIDRLRDVLNDSITEPKVKSFEGNTEVGGEEISDPRRFDDAGLQNDTYSIPPSRTPSSFSLIQSSNGQLDETSNLARPDIVLSSPKSAQ